MRLVVYPNGCACRVPIAEAEMFAKRVGGHVEQIAWDGRRDGPGGPYLSTDLVAPKPAPRRISTPHGWVRRGC